MARVVGGLFGETRRPQVRVGAGDDPELKRIRAESAVELHAFEEHPADELPCDWLGVAGRQEARTETVHGELLEAAELVLAAEVRVTLGLALVLHDLDQGLEAGSVLEVGPREGRAVRAGRREHQAGRQVRVVRDDHDVAARVGVAALAGETTAEVLEAGRVDEGDRQLGDVLVLEDDVAVEVVAGSADASGPLVGRERREAAREGTILVLLGGLQDLPPRCARGLEADLAALAAEVMTLSLGGLVVHPQERPARPVPVQHADPGVVSRQLLAVAGIPLSEQLAVIGHCREVEGT